MNWSTANVLVTGGTGSFGRAFVTEMLRRHPPKRLIVFSRDELKQHDMQMNCVETSRNEESCRSTGKLLRRFLRLRTHKESPNAYLGFF